MTETTDDPTVPLPLETLVEYHGSLTGMHGRYRVSRYETPVDANDYSPLPPDRVAEYYSDGVAYALWPDGLPWRWGERDRELNNVRRSSITVIDENTELE